MDIEREEIDEGMKGDTLVGNPTEILEEIAAV